MPVESLDDAALLLYGLAVAEFVKVRNGLEKDARQAGDRELATQIKTLRKPSVVAASLNTVVRADPEAVDQLLTAVAELRAAHEEIADGGVPDFALLQGRYRQAIQTLVDRADEARRVEVQEALEAAAVDPQSHDMLRTGTFAVAPKPTGSFGLVLGFGSGPNSDLDSGTRDLAVTKRARSAKKKAARKTNSVVSLPDVRLVKAATKELKAAKSRQGKADRRLADAQESLQDVDERVATLEADLAKALTERQNGQEAVAEAEKEAAGSAAEVDRAEDALAQIKAK